MFQASLSMGGFMLNAESPSVTQMLQAGHPVMALSSLLYGPNTVSQVKESLSLKHVEFSAQTCVLVGKVMVKALQRQ